MNRSSSPTWSAGIALGCALMIGLVGGCHNLATVVDKSGVRTIGEVIGGSGDTIVLKTSSGRPYVFSEQTIDRFIWPGTAATYVGGSFMAAGVITLAVGAAFATSGGVSEEFVAVGATTAATTFLIGLGPLVWGLMTMNDAMERSRRPADGVTVVPHVYVDHQRGSGGLRVTW